MKRLASLLSYGLCACLSAVSCSDRTDITFKDFFVCIKDESGGATSVVNSQSDQFVATYYISLVSTERDTPLTVDYDITVGNGLREGVDFVLQSESRSVTFQPGVYSRPVRINFLRRTVDPTRDNTLTLTLTGTSDPSLLLGYPGPSHYYSRHVVTKVNP